jgi:protease I
MSRSERHVAVLVEQSYQEVEVWYPVYRLREAGARVTIVGPTLGTFPSKCGYPCTADKAIGEVKPEDFDAVVIPGGWAPDYLRRVPAINQFVARLNQDGKVVASICHGGWVLCSAKMLAGRKATSFFAIADDMIHAGAQWIDAEVVVDGNLITARKPDDLPAFMKAVLAALGL